MSAYHLPMDPFQSVSPRVELIRLLIDRRVRFDPATELPNTVRIDRGGVLADRMTGVPIEEIEQPDPAAAVVDAIGHTRPAYRGFLHYCLSLAKPDWHGRPTVRLAIDLPLGEMKTNHARLGSAITASVWNAVARRVADPRDAEAEAFLRHIVENRSPAGPFLTAVASDNPETFWYHDLVLLHGIDAYADLSGDPDARAAADAAAKYHHDQTQTDHATAEPWGISAFLKSSTTIPTADALLHAVQTNQPAGPGGATLMLLADTLFRSGKICPVDGPRP